MKKTYISPALIVVGINTRQALMQTSYAISNSVSDTDAWVKEDYPSINDVNVWDDEW